jgi:hypothetical protein
MIYCFALISISAYHLFRSAVLCSPEQIRYDLLLDIGIVLLDVVGKGESDNRQPSIVYKRRSVKQSDAFGIMRIYILQTCLLQGIAPCLFRTYNRPSCGEYR